MISNERLENKLASDLSDYIVKWLKENNPSPTESCSKFDSVISLQQRIYQLEAENAQLKESGSNKRLKMSAKERMKIKRTKFSFRQQSDNRKPQQQTVSALKLRYEMEAKQRSSSDPTVTKVSRPRSLPVS
ncbi:hypothetical protein HDE_12683 [Halotydeus destructor]|nr:hypothetical protein HDE_12683 [Halotydeus destructor]